MNGTNHHATATAAFYMVALIALAIDQFSKAVIAAHWPLGHSLPVVPGLFHLTYARNTGAAFSLLAGHVTLLSVIALLVSLGLIIYQRIKRPCAWLMVVGLGLILGGALGNLIDRVWLGYVRDMLDLRWQGVNIWPIFNMADVVLMTGVALLLIHSVVEERTARRRDHAGGH